MPQNHTSKTVSLPVDLNNEFVDYISKKYPEMSVSRWVQRAIRNELKRDRRLAVLEVIDSMDEKTKNMVLEELQKKTEYAF